MDNSADLLTRGITFQQLSSSIQWRHGPTWLNSPSKWPVWPHPELLLIQADYDEEVETPPVGPPLDETTEPPNLEIQHLVDVTRFSKLSKLLSVTAYVCQFTHNTRQPSSSQLVGPLTSPELSQANLKWIHNTQQTVFAKEIANIQSCQNRLLLVRQLKLFLDNNNLLQCGGRIHNTPLSELTRFPYLLPPRHHFTTLVIQNAHVVQLHSGINATLTTLSEVLDPFCSPMDQVHSSPVCSVQEDWWSAIYQSKPPSPCEIQSQPFNSIHHHRCGLYRCLVCSYH